MRHIFGTAAIAVNLLFAAGAAAAPEPHQAQAALNVPQSADAGVPQTTDSNNISTAEHTVSDSAPVIQPATLNELVAQHRDAKAPDAEGNCLAVAIYFESKGEPLVGQLAVGQVMMNRTQSGRFPETLCGVVKQTGQFSFVRHGQFPHIAENSPAWHTALAVAEIARNDLWEPVAGKAMFFHARRVSPHWHAVQVAALGNHIFYR